MDARSKIRRMALVCAGALAIVPLTVAPAAAQLEPITDELDPEALCEEAPEEAEALFGPICEQVTDDNGENGDDNGAPIPTDPDELCALQDEAPEEFDALFDALDVVIDEVCPPEEEDEDPEDPEDPADPADPEDTDDTDDTADTTDADTTGDLPVTGGAAGLLGLGLLGAGVGLRRLLRDGDTLG